MTALALWGLVGLLVIVTGAIAFGHRWESASKRLDADIAFMRAIPSTSPAPAQAASHAEVGTPSSVTTTGAELGGDR